MNNNESLDKYEGKGEGEDIGYIPLPFVTLFLP